MSKFNPVAFALRRRKEAKSCLICGATLVRPVLIGSALVCPNFGDQRHGRPSGITLKKLKKMQRNAKRK